MTRKINRKEKNMEVGRYINPFTDFGFKTLFGQEANKDLLIDFLNEVLKLPDKITDVTYMNTERIGMIESNRVAIYDIYCKTQNNEHCIIEMQQVSQPNFFERCLYYSTFAISQQINEGFKLWVGERKKLKSYVISILNFNLKEASNNPNVQVNVSFYDEDMKTQFYDSFKFIFLQMPKFKKEIHELETHYEKWLYVLSQLPKLERMPEKLKSSIFEKVFHVAEVANFSPQEKSDYLWSVANFEKYKNSHNDGLVEGLEKGKVMGRAETMKNVILTLHKNGMSDDQIAKNLEVDIKEVMEVVGVGKTL